MQTLLLILLALVAVAAVLAYLFRDPSQDEIKQQLFIDSITGSGPFTKP